jgi:hypothetical protein
LAYADEGQCGRIADREEREPDRAPAGWQQGYGEFEPGRSTSRPADSDGRDASKERRLAGPTSMAGWTRADWIICTDGKARPIAPGSQQMADGSAESLGRLRPNAVAAAEREIADACQCKADPGEALHDLWHALSAEASREWASGRPQRVSEARFLLAFLRQLSEQGWAFKESISRASAETAEAKLRSVRSNRTTSRAPYQRRLDGQYAVEHSDLVHLLSSILARHAQAAWAEAFDKNACSTFPLAIGQSNRVGRLRAYGNAMHRAKITQFILASQEAIGDLTCP